MKKTTMKGDVIGVGLACAYAIVAPVMLQNSFEPFLPGRFGRMQFSDLLAPLMLMWLLFRFRDGGLPRVLGEDGKLLLFFGLLYVACGPISSLLADDGIALADMLKRCYVVLTLVFFVQIFRIENAAFIILWLTVYILLIISAFALLSYLIFLITGESNPFVQIGSSIIFDKPAGHLTGPMKPTENLFATYLILFSGVLFVGANHMSRQLWSALAAVSMTCALLTLSRPGALACLFIFLALLASSKSKVMLISLFLFPAVLAVLVLEASAVLDLRKLASAVSQGSVSPENLVLVVPYHLKVFALKLWIANPLLGVGPENYAEAWLLGSRSGEIPEHLRHIVPETPDSTYLYLLVETGLFGLASWVGLLFVALRRLPSKWIDIPGGKYTLSLWFGCVALAMIDLNVINFRFIYYMIPLIAAVPTRNLGIPPQSDL